MLELLGLILIMAGLFKLTGVMIRLAGRLLGGIISLFGWLVLGVLAVTLLGLALYVLPVMLIVGAAALITAA